MTWWLRTVNRAPAFNRVVLAAGPDLAVAVDEIHAIAPAHASATVEVMEEAACAHFRRAAAGARLVHVACHGRLRADSLTFSALRLHDGPLTVPSFAARPPLGPRVL